MADSVTERAELSQQPVPSLVLSSKRRAFNSLLFAAPVLAVALVAYLVLSLNESLSAPLSQREDVQIRKHTSGTVNTDASLRWSTTEIASPCLRPRVRRYVVTLFDVNNQPVGRLEVPSSRRAVRVGDIASGLRGRFYWQVEGLVSFEPVPWRRNICHMMIPEDRVVLADGGAPYAIEIAPRRK